jgi:hypothetical protein
VSGPLFEIDPTVPLFLKVFPSTTSEMLVFDFVQEIVCHLPSLSVGPVWIRIPDYEVFEPTKRQTARLSGRISAL